MTPSSSASVFVLGAPLITLGSSTIRVSQHISDIWQTSLFAPILSLCASPLNSVEKAKGSFVDEHPVDARLHLSLLDR